MKRVKSFNLFEKRNYNPFKRKIPVLKKFNDSGLILVDPEFGECYKDIPEEKWIDVVRSEDDKIICKVFLHNDSDCYVKYGENLELKKEISHPEDPYEEEDWGDRKDFIWKEYEGDLAAPHCIWDAYFWIIKNLI